MEHWYKKMEACACDSDIQRQLNQMMLLAEIRSHFLRSLMRSPSEYRVNLSPEYLLRNIKMICCYGRGMWKLIIMLTNLSDSGRHRNIIVMNAGLGSFSAALESPKLWVVNVMPTIAEKDTPGVITNAVRLAYIMTELKFHANGTEKSSKILRNQLSIPRILVLRWCEAFSTYPQAYDLIHADSVSVFNLYNNKCKAEDILLEMDRILRLEGAVIIREQGNVLNKAKKIAMNLPEMNCS